MSHFNILLSKESTPFSDHLPELLRLYDEATLWLVSQGRTGQWGSGVPSAEPHFVKRVATFLEKSEEWKRTMIFARASGGSPIVGILVYDQATTPGSQIPQIAERELYIHLLLTTRDPTYRGLGRRLVTEAVEEARRRGIKILRLSCYASEDRKLISAYEKMGFIMNPEDIIVVSAWGEAHWPKAVMEMRLEELPETAI